ncbi:GCN5-related N-acetyltransferase [Gilbertella persicaria]|uniref:GCN5-related N-acetyltransferase n=1 Tax=Gilbertella persicaria TaxID=101096 RepID=UPI00221E9E51|nr:GCN5-related N-acetyltransferase [Gilbertella persicaria]KAI8072140.1 GCN5-related N-acetyltransferase [Gilbertella persicaria]
MPYRLKETLPDPQTYCSIRIECELSPRTLESATAALPRSIYGVSIIDENEKKVVGMGRIIGDEFAFMYVVDQGLGKVIMTAIMDYVDKHATKDCDVVLLAVGSAKHLYAKFGFNDTAPRTIAMRYQRDAPKDHRIYFR